MTKPLNDQYGPTQAMAPKKSYYQNECNLLNKSLFTKHLDSKIVKADTVVSSAPSKIEVVSGGDINSASPRKLSKGSVEKNALGRNADVVRKPELVRTNNDLDLDQPVVRSSCHGPKGFLAEAADDKFSIIEDVEVETEKERLIDCLTSGALDSISPYIDQSVMNSEIRGVAGDFYSVFSIESRDAVAEDKINDELLNKDVVDSGIYDFRTAQLRSDIGHTNIAREILEQEGIVSDSNMLAEGFVSESYGRGTIEVEKLFQGNIGSSDDSQNNGASNDTISINDAFIGFVQGYRESKSSGVIDANSIGDQFQITNDKLHQDSLVENMFEPSAEFSLKLTDNMLNMRGQSSVNSSRNRIKLSNDELYQAARPIDSLISSSVNLLFADDHHSDVTARFFASLEDARSEIAEDHFMSEESKGLVDVDIAEISDADAGTVFSDRSFNAKGIAQEINSFGGKIEDSFANKRLSISFRENFDNPEDAPKEFEQVSMSVRHAIASNRSEVKINMYPRALGAIDITLEIVRGDAGEQVVRNIKISTENKQTLEILEKSQIELQKTLSDVKESKDASLEFSMKKQGDQQGSLLYSNSDEREAWMNQFESRDGSDSGNGDSRDKASGASSVVKAENSDSEVSAGGVVTMPGRMDIKV